MLDIKYIRENADAVQQAAKDKNIDIDISALLSVDKERVRLMQEVESLQSMKNDINDLIKAAKNDVGRAEAISKGKEIKSKLEIKAPQLREITSKYMELMVSVPTVPANDVPVGVSEDENVVAYEKGEKPKFDFEPRTHVELAEMLDIVDFKKGAEISGYRGYYLKNEGAEIVMALMMYAAQKMVSKGFTMMIPPTIVKERALFGTGYFKGMKYDADIDEIYQIDGCEQDCADGSCGCSTKYLVGTSEPSLLAYYADKVLDHKDLPLKLCGFSQCYRSEIGSHGRDTTGLYRVHEFMKIEQVVIAPADVDVTEELQKEMVGISEEVHRELGLPYRKLVICTGDMSAGKYRMFDLEAWMPGLDRWGETGSASNFLDWQSRRLNARYKDEDGTTKHVYMLNNTVLPSVRPLIAILENFQMEDGSVKIPEVLQPFMPGGKKVIEVKQ